MAEIIQFESLLDELDDLQKAPSAEKFYAVGEKCYQYVESIKVDKDMSLQDNLNYKSKLVTLKGKSLSELKNVEDYVVNVLEPQQQQAPVAPVTQMPVEEKGKPLALENKSA